MVTVRLFAAARAAAGTSQVALAPAPVAHLVAELRDGLPPDFARVLAVSSLVWDGTRLDPSGATPIPSGAVIDVLPPFAGG